MSDHISVSADEAADRLAIRYSDTFVKEEGTWLFAERRPYLWTGRRPARAAGDLPAGRERALE
jgi:hypothetical protein